MTSCSAIKLGGSLARGPLLEDWLGIGQLVLSNCFHLHPLSFLGFISLYFLFSFSLLFLLLLLLLFYFNY